MRRTDAHNLVNEVFDNHIVGNAPDPETAAIIADVVSGLRDEMHNLVDRIAGRADNVHFDVHVDEALSLTRDDETSESDPRTDR